MMPSVSGFVPQNCSLTTAEVAKASVRLLVDLRLLLPGGMNGGIKPGFFGLFQEVRRRAGAQISCCFLTNSWTHQDLGPLRSVGDSAICAHLLEGRKLAPQYLIENDSVELAPLGDWLKESDYDIYYNPLCEETPEFEELPIIVLHADTLHADYPNTLTPEVVARRHAFFSRNVRIAMRIQTISKFSEDRIHDLYPESKQKTFVTRLPIQGRLRQAIEKIENDRVESKDFDYFVYPANFWIHKNHDFLLRAYAYYVKICRAKNRQPWKLVLTGHTDDSSVKIMNLAVSLGLEDSVIHKGFLNISDFAFLIQRAGCLVYPSLYEGFGMPPLEAMELGVPVLCSRCGSLPEVVQQGAWTLNVDSSENWGEAMWEIAESSSVRQELSERGSAVVSNYSLVDEAQNLLDEFFRVAGVRRIASGQVDAQNEGNSKSII